MSRGDPTRPPGNGLGNGLSLSAWGATLKAHGRDVILIVILIAGFGTIALLLRDAGLLFAGETQRRMAEHQSIVTAQNELACVLALPQDDRPPALTDPQGICHYVTTIYRFQPTQRERP